MQGVNGGGAQDGEQVAHWVIQYADGTSREWPVIYGNQVRDWFFHEELPEDASHAVIAWKGHAPDDRGTMGGGKVRLFKATWTNPVPEVEIRSLDFVLDTGNVCPFVVAITAE